MNVLIFGLGRHGGGAAAAEFFCRRGDRVTVTDIADRADLEDSIRLLDRYPIVWHLGCHREEDVSAADLIIKNPAVSPDHPLLAEHPNIHSDVSYLLPELDLPTIAVTGTKGKSSNTAAVAWALDQLGCQAVTAGNIGISLFALHDRLQLGNKQPRFSGIGKRGNPCSDGRPVLVVELSSWQLRDLARYCSPPLPLFDAALVTSLFPDHLDAYPDAAAYYHDKAQIFRFLDPEGWGVIPEDALARLGIGSSAAYRMSLFETAAVKFPEAVRSVEAPSISGLEPAAALLSVLGWEKEQVASLLGRFPGLPHRREVLETAGSVRFMNDSAATVPEAVLFTISMLAGSSIHLIAGGSDKLLAPAVMLKALRQAATVHLLGGSFTARLIPVLEMEGIPFSGPHCTMKSAVSAAVSAAAAKSSACRESWVLLSPGAASFGLFSHEFDRGDQFRRHAGEFSRI